MPSDKLTSGLGKRCGWLMPVSHHLDPILGCTSAIAVVSFATIIQPAQAAILESWQFDPATNQLEITLADGTRPRYAVLEQPPIIILDLPNTQLGRVPEQKIYTGAVRQIRVSQFQPGLARIAIELSPDVVLSPAQVQLQQVAPSGRRDRAAQRWILRPLVAGFDAAASSPLPPARFSERQTPVVSVPPLRTPPTVETRDRSPRPSSTRPVREPAVVSPIAARDGVIQFGEPLPNPTPLPARPRTIPTFDAPSPALPSARRTPSRRLTDARLLEGTPIELYYPRETPLRLQGGQSRQEVLRLAEDLRDRSGRLIARADTPVIGRFESDNRGSRFITQAIILRGRNLPLVASSDRLSGDRKVSEGRLARNSGIGAVAGLLIGGISGVGLLAGAAAAATATVLTADQPVTIEPGQIVEVRLIEDWR